MKEIKHHISVPETCTTVVRLELKYIFSVQKFFVLSYRFQIRDLPIHKVLKCFLL